LKIIKAYQVLTKKYQEPVFIEVELQKSDACEMVKEKQKVMIKIE